MSDLPTPPDWDCDGTQCLFLSPTPIPNPEDRYGNFFFSLSFLLGIATVIWPALRRWFWSFMADNLMAFPLLPLNPSWCSALPGPALLHLWVGVGVYISIYISLYIVYILLLVLPL